MRMQQTSTRSKIAWHDGVLKTIHGELCKKLKFTTKYTHKQEPAQENETYKILLDFEIQTDH